MSKKQVPITKLQIVSENDQKEENEESADERRMTETPGPGASIGSVAPIGPGAPNPPIDPDKALSFFDRQPENVKLALIVACTVIFVVAAYKVNLSKLVKELGLLKKQ